MPQQKKEGESAAKESTGAIKAGRPRVAGGGGSFLPGHLGSTLYTEQLCTVPVVNNRSANAKKGPLFADESKKKNMKRKKRKGRQSKP